MVLSPQSLVLRPQSLVLSPQSSVLSSQSSVVWVVTSLSDPCVTLPVQVGPGHEATTDIPPVISPMAKERIEGLIQVTDVIFSIIIDI